MAQKSAVFLPREERRLVGRRVDHHPLPVCPRLRVEVDPRLPVRNHVVLACEQSPSFFDLCSYLSRVCVGKSISLFKCRTTSKEAFVSHRACCRLGTRPLASYCRPCGTRTSRPVRSETDPSFNFRNFYRVIVPSLSWLVQSLSVSFFC